MRELIYTKQSDLPIIRKELLIKQNYICPITKLNLLECKETDSCVDHKHKQYKNQVLGEDNIGMIRGILHRFANSLEGRVQGAFNRSGLVGLGLELPSVLRNLADYLEQESTNYVHPSEVPKEPNLKKSCYNVLVKTLKQQGYSKKIPEYPNSKKVTIELKKLFTLYNIEIQYY